MPLQHALLQCVAIGVAYVAPFYCRGSHARDHSSTIKFRMASTVATSLLAWLPLYHQVYNKVEPAHKGASCASYNMKSSICQWHTQQAPDKQHMLCTSDQKHQTCLFMT